MSAYRVLFGDIHDHAAHGAGAGSIERALDIARTHLDFCAFTGHASRHDAAAPHAWPHLQQAIADANRDGDFCGFLGFGWHSAPWGDQCVVFPADHRPLPHTSDLRALREFCRREQALMIPHHQGSQGIDWDAFREDCTPVVDIHAGHHEAEEGRAPTTGAPRTLDRRQTPDTARAGLGQGLRFGFIGASHGRAGFPGACGEGLMAALVTDFSRAGIFEAIRARRTCALTGDRIEVDFTVEGAPMGSTIEAGRQVEASFCVHGRDAIEVVEIIQDGDVVHRAHAAEAVAPDLAFDQPVQVRLEWGWEPRGAAAPDGILDWAMEVTVEGGRIARYFPCLQSLPFDAERRHRFARRGPDALAIRSYSARQGARGAHPHQSVVLELEADADAMLHLELSEPAQQSSSSRLGDLQAASHGRSAASLPGDGYRWHRLLPAAAATVQGRCTLAVPPGRSNLYLRARQKNGHLAWASPVFLNYR